VRFGEPLELARPLSGELPRDRRRRAVEQLTESVRMLSARNHEEDLTPDLQEQQTASQFHS